MNLVYLACPGARSNPWNISFDVDLINHYTFLGVLLVYVCLESYCAPLYIEHFQVFLVGNSSTIPDEKYSISNSYKPTRPPTHPFFIAQVHSPWENHAYILPFIFSYIYSFRLKHFYPMEISCAGSTREW